MAGRRFLFAGGGTGGHLFPGIAVAECLLERETDAEILFVGSDRDVERDILAATPYEHCALPEVRLDGILRHPLRFLRTSLAARREAFALMDRREPDVVIGCGGFASAAPVYAAYRRGTPFILLEQNVIPGRATRWLSRLGGTVCGSFEEIADSLPETARFLVTGNPVRRDVAVLSGSVRNDTKTLLVLGGSQGAEAVNTLMASVVTRISGLFAGWRVIHQTGKAGEQRMARIYKEARVDAEVAAFFDDLASRYQQASLVVARAGATTLAELACAGLPAIVIPYPHARNDHQRHNAQWYQSRGAAILVDERNRTTDAGQQFHELLREILSDGHRRSKIAAAMATHGRPDAAANVVNVLSAMFQ